MAKRGIEHLQSREKRIFDIMGALALLGVFLPAAAAVGAASAINNRSLDLLVAGDKFGGRGEESFRTYKIRTRLETKFGITIKQCGLDELPQLLNVFRGDMSLVGTRPYTQNEVIASRAADPKLFEEWYPNFRSVKPGFTSPSQIYRHGFRVTSAAMWAESMAMDLEYYNTATLEGDIALLCTTPWAMVKATAGVVDNRVDDRMAA